MAAQAPRAGEFTGRHMLLILVAFFTVVIGVNVAMSVAAVTSWTGLVVENSYVASQEFNGKLQVAHQRDALGWKGGMAYEAGELVFSLVGKDGAPIPLGDVTVEVSRPIGTKGDRTVNLALADDGTHRIGISLDKGIWNAAIVARVPGEADYEHRARLLVSP